MRDDKIIDMNQRRAHNEAILAEQLSFINARMEAYETLLSSRWAIVRAIIRPKWLANAVNVIQAALMKAHADEMRKIREKKKEEAAKPKLTIVGPNGIKAMVALVALILTSGCVSRPYHTSEMAKAYKTGYDQADKECLALQARIAKYMESLKERLRRYDQLDEKGNLKPLKKWTGDTWEDDVNEDKPWAK